MSEMLKSIEVKKQWFINSHKEPIEQFYEFHQEIGKGNYGTVVKAKDVHSNRHFAIKIIQKNRIEDSHLFKQEVEILQLLDHPNIVKLIECFETERLCYLVQEYCEGGELFQKLAKEKNLSELKAAQIMRKLISAVMYCHANSICHRDLKPENCLMVSTEADSDIKIIDFGLACFLSEQKALNCICGTPFYVAPEVLAGSYRSECDMWSLGVMLYMMLSGTPPFYGKNNQEIITKVYSGNYSLRLKQFSKVSQMAKDLISRLLVKDPALRLTAKDAFNHPWIQILSPVPERPLPSKTYEDINNFVHFSKFKRATLMLISSRLTEKEISYLKQLFVAIDQDGSGTISRSEFDEAFSKISKSVRREDLDNVWRVLDMNHNGEIDYSEFICACISGQACVDSGILKSAFEFYDEDKDGFITVDELKNVFLTGEVSIRLNEIQQMIQTFDKNSDGKVDYMEFIEAMVNSKLPEQGKELRTTLPLDYTQEQLGLAVGQCLGAPVEAFILLTSEGCSLKDRPLNLSNSEIIYAFLKDSIKQERAEIVVRFIQNTSIALNPLPGDDKGVLTMEKNLHRMYKQALEMSDFFTSYASFAEQISTEMEIVKSATHVLKLYHDKHIQDQADNFAALQQKSQNHYQNAQREFDSFDLAVQKLSSTLIHEQLRNPSRVSLSDLIDVNQLRKWKESYIDEINRLQSKFEEIKATIESMPSVFKLPEEDFSNVEIILVPDMVTQGYSSVIELYLDYRKLCELFLTSRDAKAGQRLHEEDWQQKANKANQNLSILAKTLPQYQSMVGGLQDLRKVGNFQLFKLLRKITEFAARIRDSVKSQLSMLSSLLKRSEKRLAFVKVPRLLPEAHDSAIIEISRRNVFVQVASKIKDRLNLLIETETAERMAFLEKYRHVLPNNFVPQLSAGPFLKVVAGNNEPDLNLPEVFQGLPSNFLHTSLYEQRFSNEENHYKNLLEQKENLEVQVRNLNENLEALKKMLDAKNEELRTKDAQLELQSQALMKEVNKCKLVSQTAEFEKAELRKGYSELENKLKMIKTAVCAEHSEQIKELQAVYNESSACIRALESKFKASQAAEAQARTENEKIREDMNRITAEVRVKDKRLIEAADTLKTIQIEFKNKEDLIKELKEKLSQMPKMQEIKPRDSPCEELCRELGIPSEGLPGYIKRLKESDSAKIAFTSFNEGSLALFFPTAEGQFLAFNYNCPDHFLNTDLLSPQTIEAMHNEPYIVGLITEKKKLVAERNNPINLPQGSEYFLLSIKTEF